MLFTAALAMLVIGATGLLPGLISTRSDASAHLRSGGRSMASGNSRLRRGLVVAQVTLCFLLLLSASVFVRGLVITIGELPPHAPHTLIAELRFDVLSKYGPAERRAFIDDMTPACGPTAACAESHTRRAARFRAGTSACGAPAICPTQASPPRPSTSRATFSTSQVCACFVDGH
jgi:hypothetical protein